MMIYIALFLVFILGIMDIRYRKITVIIPVLLVVLGIMRIIVYGKIIVHILGILPGLLVLILALLTREKIGIGDAILLIGLGIFLGIYDIFRTLLIAFSILFVVSIVLLVIYKKKTLMVPFIPFVFFGMLGVMIL